MEDKKVVFVRKNVIAVDLIRQGFTILDLKVNSKQPQKTIFCFEDRDNIREIIDELKLKYWN